MPFVIIGIILVVAGWHFRSNAIKGHDHEGIIGSTALVIAGVILIVLFGLLYRTLILYGNV
jgi:uncharacterized membrane protein